MYMDTWRNLLAALCTAVPDVNLGLFFIFHKEDRGVVVGWWRIPLRTIEFYRRSVAIGCLSGKASDVCAKRAIQSTVSFI
jgi:hypothetical protein